MSNILKQKESEIDKLVKKETHNETTAYEEVSIHNSSQKNNPQYHEMLLAHEHDLVPYIKEELNCFQCLTCDKMFCQLCGKSVDGNSATVGCKSHD